MKMNPLALIKSLSIKYWILIILFIVLIILIIIKLTLNNGITSERFSFTKTVENYSNANLITDAQQLQPKKNEVIFAKFYAPWCGYCTQLQPTWSELTDKFNQQTVNNKKIKVVKVNCDDYPKIAEKYDVNGYPTIKMFTSSGEQDYNDERNLESMQKFLLKTCNQ